MATNLAIDDRLINEARRIGQKTTKKAVVTEALRDHLRGFPDLPLAAEDYELAAEYFTTLRAKGIQGSNTDFLVCATATRRDLSVLTTDKDFPLFRTVVPLKLHRPRNH